MKRYILWFLAMLITLGAAVYQRLTGPTYPFRAQAALDGQPVSARLPRSAENTANCEIKLRGIPGDVGGYVEYMRHKTRDAWTRIPLERSQGALTASLPKQPAAGKLAYRVVLVKGDRETVLSGDKPVVIRFKGVVPNWILIPHIFVMFAAMLLSTAAGIAALAKKAPAWKRFALVPGILLFILGIAAPTAIVKIVGIPKLMSSNMLGNLAWMGLLIAIGVGALLAALPVSVDYRRLANWAAVFVFVGGFILGPLVQKYAFGVFWSGIPLGTDMTDNKTLIAFVGWLIALFLMRKGKPGRAGVVAAAILLLAVYSIPHSVLGSELDYSKLPPPSAAETIK
jgi:hypothetical protein